MLAYYQQKKTVSGFLHQGTRRWAYQRSATQVRRQKVLNPGHTGAAHWAASPLIAGHQG